MTLLIQDKLLISYDTIFVMAQRQRQRPTVLMACSQNLDLNVIECPQCIDNVTQILRHARSIRPERFSQ